MLSAAVAVYLFVTHSWAAVTATGSGTVTDKIGRDEASTPAHDARSLAGLYVELNGHTQVRVPPTSLWNALQNGDNLQKESWSYAYVVNGVRHSTFPDIISATARMAVFAFLFWCAVLVLFRMLRTPRDQREPVPRKPDDPT